MDCTNLFPQMLCEMLYGVTNLAGQLLAQIFTLLSFSKAHDGDHLSLVRNVFSGIPTLAKEILSQEELLLATGTGDIL